MGGGQGEVITAFIGPMARMTLEPLTAKSMRGTEEEKLLPEINVGCRLPVLLDPPACLPGFSPKEMAKAG